MAARSTHVILINRTHNNLRKTEEHLDQGVWEEHPPQLVGDRAVWASESEGFGAGTEGAVTFQIESVGASGSGEQLGQVQIHWDNPYEGTNSYDASVLPQASNAQSGFSVGFFGGGGDEAQVTFVLSDGQVRVDPDTGEITATQESAPQAAVGLGDRYAAIWQPNPGQSWAARHGLTNQQYQQAFDDHASQGFRLMEVCGYGIGDEDRYAAYWVQTESPPWQARHGLTNQEYQQAFDELANQGYRPTMVCGYNVGGQDRFAGIWEQAPSLPWQARHGLTSQQYQQTFDQLLDQGFRLTYVSGYEVGGEDRYAAIWDQSPSPPWQARHGLTAQQYQQAFEQLLGQGFRPIHISGYTVGGQDRFAAIWHNDGIGFQARYGLDSQQYQQTYDEMLANNFMLGCISGYGS